MAAEELPRLDQPAVQFPESVDRSPIIITKEDVILLWRSVGASKGLVADMDIARFLLTAYHIKKDLEDSLCIQCNSPLTLYCPKCQLLSQNGVSAPPTLRPPPPSGQAPSSHQSQPSHQEKPAHLASSHQDISHQLARPVTPPSAASVYLVPTQPSVQDAPPFTANQTASDKRKRRKGDSVVAPALDRPRNAKVKSKEKRGVGRPKKRQKTSNRKNIVEKKKVAERSEKLPPEKEQASAAKEPYPTVEEFMAEVCAAAVEAVKSEVNPTRKSRRETGLRNPRLNSHGRKDALFACSLCGEKFKKKRELQRHGNTMHRYHCRYCPETFASMEEKREHKRVVHKIPFACPDCGKVFSSRRDLLKHAPVHAEKKGFPCSKCDYVGRSQKLLDRHMDTHEKKRHQCEFCGINFCTRSYLADHVQQHTGKQFVCTDCGAAFARPFNLRIHRMNHAGLKPFVCSLCGKAFAHKFSLTLHLRIHSDHRPYACEFCPAKFKRRDYLTKHRRLHTGERPYRCKVCLKTFIEVTVMKKHQRRCHPDKAVICETTLPTTMTLPTNTTLPTSTTLPTITTLPTAMTLPPATTLPTTTTLPPNLTLPTTMTLPTTIPSQDLGDHPQLTSEFVSGTSA